MGSKKWTARPFESIGKRFEDPYTGKLRGDSSANIYESMLLHPAFRTLKPRQQMLYVLCKSQFYGHKKPSDETGYKDIDAFKSDMCFFLNLAAVVRYGLYTRNMRGKFYADMKELQRRGFIEVLSSGASTKKKSVYKFSGNWKQWTPEEN